MTINGLDISLYQEIDWQNKFIDWQALAKDPRNFQYIWIKAAEGELAYPSPSSYPVDVFDRQVTGAKSAGCFKQINPYHFYYYQVPWDYDSNGNVTYYILNPTKQAEAFAAALKGVKYSHPLTDIEAPHVLDFLNWYDTDTINKAITFALKVNAHLKKYHEEVTRLCGKPDIYTGAWWWGWQDPNDSRKGGGFAKLLLDNGYASELAWIKEYKFYIANYTSGGVIVPVSVPRENVIAWQFTSTPKEPINSIPSSSNVDCAQWVGSDAQWNLWSGSDVIQPPIGETTVAKTFNINTLQKNRAKIFTLERTAKITTTFDKIGADAVVIEMGGMPLINGYCKPQDYESFGSRCTEASKYIPVIAQFDLNTGNWLKDGNLTAPEAEKPFKENIITKEIIDGWHNGTWSWDSILTGKGSWRNISALEFVMTSTKDYNNSLIENDWQRRVLETILNHIKSLQDGGFAPKIPVIIYTGPWWLSLYDVINTPFYNLLQKNKTWLYLRLGQWVRASTSIFEKLEDIFAFPPDDSFEFYHKNDSGEIVYTYPDGYFTRIISHEWSGQAQRSKTVVDEFGVPVSLYLSSGYDTKSELYKFLNFSSGTIIPPIIIPPTTEEVTNAMLLTEIKNLETKLEALWYSVFKR